MISKTARTVRATATATRATSAVRSARGLGASLPLERKFRRSTVGVARASSDPADGETNNAAIAGSAALIGGSLAASAALSPGLVEPFTCKSSSQSLLLFFASASNFSLTSLFITAYFNAIGVPVINFLNPPEFVIHWFHAINMSVVLFAMGGYGTYLGYQIRGGEGNAEAFGGEKVRELHPKLMAGMTFFFFLGGQGGLVFTIMENRPLLSSPHAVSALAGLSLLGLQGVLGATMKGKPAAKAMHTYLGSSIMALLVAHAGLGLVNGLSF